MTTATSRPGKFRYDWVPSLDDELGQDLNQEERNVLSALLRRVSDSLELAPGVHPHLATRVR